MTRKSSTFAALQATLAGGAIAASVVAAPVSADTDVFQFSPIEELTNKCTHETSFKKVCQDERE